MLVNCPYHQEIPHTDQNSTPQNSRPASSERTIDNDGQGFVGDNIAQKECNQYPVLSLFNQMKHACSIFSFSNVSWGFDNLQIDLIL